MSRVFRLVHKQARERAVAAVIEAPEGYQVLVKEPARDTSANAAMWVRLQAFSEQLQWPVNGEMVYLTPDDWKHILSAAYERETNRVAPGLDGGFVMLGQRTSRWSQSKMAGFITFLDATAVERGVVVPEMETV